MSKDEADENQEEPKKPKYFADQFDDEEVLYVFRKHPIVMRKGLIIGLSMLVVGTLPTAFKPTLGFGWFFGGIIIGAVVGALIMLPYWIGWYYSVFIVTDQQLIQISQKGLFHRSVVDMRLNQIQMVNYQIAGLEQTVLGYGTISMQTLVGDLVIHSVHHPAKVQKKILEILRDEGVTSVSYSTSTEYEAETEPELEDNEA